MKKIISSILCLVMVLSMSTAAFAQTNDFVLTYSNEPSYQITIPDSSNIDVSTGKSTIDIAVSDANLAEGTAVSVSISSANYENDSWYLVNTKDNDDKIAYNIGTTDGGDDVVSGSNVLSANGATDTTLYVTVSDTSKVGTFTDTITFTSEIVNLISFKIGDDVYFATEGMTWDQWIVSSYNTDGFIVHAGAVSADSGTLVGLENGDLFTSDNLIVDNGIYIFTMWSH